MRRPAWTLRRSEEGATIIEFALIAPVLFLLIMGVFDMGHRVYVKVILDGAMEDAARHSTVEVSPTEIAKIDARMEAQILQIAPNAEVKVERFNFFSYNDIGQAELFDDKNGNGVCDANETYEDKNDNGRWDATLAKEGIGGARDVVEYHVSVSYDQLFPLWKMLGIDQRTTLSSQTVLKNEPYAKQATRTAVTRTCP